MLKKYKIFTMTSYINGTWLLLQSYLKPLFRLFTMLFQTWCYRVITRNKVLLKSSIFFLIPYVSNIMWHWSFSFWLHLVWKSLGPSMLLQMALFHYFNGWVIFHCIYVPLLFFLIYFFMKDNGFTEFCCFLSNLNMN